MLGTTAALSGVMGVTLTMAIGGADMPGKFNNKFIKPPNHCYFFIYMEELNINHPPKFEKIFHLPECISEKNISSKSYKYTIKHF